MKELTFLKPPHTAVLGQPETMPSGVQGPHIKLGLAHARHVFNHLTISLGTRRNYRHLFKNIHTYIFFYF